MKSLKWLSKELLTHWGRVTYICVSKLTIIGSDNGLSPGRRQAIIWTNAGILLIGTLGTNFNEILSEIHTFSFKKMHLKTSSAKWRPFSLGLNVLSRPWTQTRLSRGGCLTTHGKLVNSVMWWCAHTLHTPQSNPDITVKKCFRVPH